METKKERKRQKNPNLTHAINSQGEWVHVESVPTGFACDCVCPRCHSRLQARNSIKEGRKRAPHFAHAKGSDCVCNDETAQHILAKEILEECKIVLLPKLPKEENCQTLSFDKVVSEQYHEETGLRPDCICYYEDKTLWVEFKRTHEVDARKADKIRKAQIDCIEIDLTDCNINKETIKKRIISDPEKRVWIYNKQYNYTNKCYSSNSESFEYIPIPLQVIQRHYAYDEEGRIINLNRLPQNYRVDKHQFYCFGCHQLLKIDEDHFEHLHDDVKCSDKIYLRNAAIEMLYYKFYNNEHLYAHVIASARCNRHGECPFFDAQYCNGNYTEEVDLKQLGYVICEKKSRLPDGEYYDIVLRKADSYRDAIVFFIKNEDCEREIDTTRPFCERWINGEEDLVALRHKIVGIIRKINNRNLTCEEKYLPPSDSLYNDVMKFTMYHSGKYYYEEIPCTQLLDNRQIKTAAEFTFSGSIDPEDAELISLMECKKRNIPGFYCKICAYLKQNEGFAKPICTRFIRQGTPKHPLDKEHKPISCQFFRMYLVAKRQIPKNKIFEIINNEFQMLEDSEK